MNEQDMEVMQAETNSILSKKEIKALRHKSERRWYRFMVVLNLLLIIGIGAAMIHSIRKNQQLYQDIKTAAVQYDVDASAEDQQAADKHINELVDSIPVEVQWGVMGILIIIILPLSASYMYAAYRSNSVQITEKTFPEIYDIVVEYSKRLGFKKTPKVYLVQGNGIMNAFSSFIPFKQYVELYADLIEVAYREHHDLDSIRFVIAHEMSHIKLKHAKMYYNYSILFSNMIPIFSQTASRTREYSCDRIAQKLSGTDGIDAMMVLTVGKHMYKDVDKEDYIEHCKEVKGFFVWLNNLFADHPVTTKRVVALANPDKHGKLY